jgi:hypothetical protein
LSERKNNIMEYFESIVIGHYMLRSNSCTQ